MQNNYEKFTEVFENLITNIEGLKAVVFVTDWSEIQDWQKHNSVYPCLVVEMPDITINADTQTDIFETNYSVITGCPKNETFAYYKQQHVDMFGLVRQVHYRLNCIDGQNGICYEASEKYQAIIHATSDNCYGWRSDNFELEIR